MRKNRHDYLANLLCIEPSAESARFLETARVKQRFEELEIFLQKQWAIAVRTAARNKALPIAQFPVLSPAPPAVTAHSTPPKPPPAADQKALPPMPIRPPAPPTEGPRPAASQGTTPVVPAPPVGPSGPPSASPLPQSPPLSPVLRDRPAASFKLRNARQSEAYAEALAPASSPVPIRLVRVSIPPDLGLTWNKQTGLLEGVPLRSGEVALGVVYRFADDPPEGERVAPVMLYVNPDPKLLWKNLPSDSTDPLWKPDSAAQFVQGMGKQMLAARQRGRSHAHVGTCCDDDFHLELLPATGWHIAIVADGAGSAKASRRGSQVAVRAAGDHLRQFLSSDSGVAIEDAALALQAAPSDDTLRKQLHNALYMAVGHAAYHAMKALHEEWQARPELIASLKDLATTLLVGVARKVGSKWLCAAYWVGDGAVGVYRKGVGVELLGEVDAGEYSGQTRFLDAAEVSSEALFKRTRFTLCEDFTAFILMTDGVSDPKFETEAQLANPAAWDALWEDLQLPESLPSENGSAEAQRLLAWLDFWSQGNHDDRTLAIVF